MARLRERAVRVAYAEIVDPQVLADGADVEVWAERFRNPRGISNWVWEEAGRLAGLAAAGESDEDDLDAVAVGCLYALYVDPGAQGAGVGRALHDRALEELRAAGAREAVLWVLVGNERARRFYERLGWRAEEDRVEDDPHWLATSIRYRRTL